MPFGQARFYEWRENFTRNGVNSIKIKGCIKLGAIGQIPFPGHEWTRRDLVTEGRGRPLGASGWVQTG